MPGPLSGVRVVELAGRGPGPFGAMVLADLGADVVRVVRPGEVDPPASGSADERMAAGHRQLDLVLRGRRSVAVDLKQPAGLETALRLVDSADVLIEGNRPGVTERLGIGPDACLERNPRLVYARMTGWGQTGPMAQLPGHDLNYVALAGALVGDPPAPALNLVGDYGGGGMLLVVGILAALQERSVSGLGQVVDAAMVDGISLLTTTVHAMRAEGMWVDEPGGNVLDLAAPFYNVYETADGRHVTLGAGEPQFWAETVRLLELPVAWVATQHDRSTWAERVQRLQAVFRAKTFDEWRDLLETSDTCFAPVLTLAEAPQHPQLRARETFVEVGGVVQPNAAPRFSRTPGGVTGLPPAPGSATVDVLRDSGFTDDEIGELIAARAVVQSQRS